MKQQHRNDVWFGTDGIRKKVGHAPLTIEHLPKLGFAIGQQIINRYGPHAHLLLGHDTRISCSFIKAAIETGLLLHPITIHDAQILSTPAVCRLVKENPQMSAGIIITASHNHYQDNGIKIVDTDGIKNKADAAAIEKLFVTQSEKISNYNTLGSINVWHNAADNYISSLCKLFPPKFLTGITVALDCANGASSQIAPKIFTTLGATVIIIHNQPTGTNINAQCGALHTDDLVKTVKENKADIGFACDGDGDRLVVITKDCIKKNGDDILALLLQHPHYAHEDTIVGTIMTNEGFKTWLAEKNKKLIRAEVGEPSIIELLNHHNLKLGGEPSGHIVMADYLCSSDAICVALRLLEIIIETNNWKLATFDQYPQINLTVPVSVKKPLSKQPFLHIIETAKKMLPKGRLIIRYSGTESILRITTEDHDKEHAQQIAHIVAEKLKQAFVQESKNV